MLYSKISMKKYIYKGSDIIRFTHFEKEITLESGSVCELNESDTHIQVLIQTGKLELYNEPKEIKKEIKN